MKKVAGIILLVNRIEESVAFYRKLGFEVIKEVRDTATTLSLGEFWVELLHNNKVISEEYKEDTKNSAKGAEVFLMSAI